MYFFYWIFFIFSPGNLIHTFNESPPFLLYHVQPFHNFHSFSVIRVQVSCPFQTLSRGLPPLNLLTLQLFSMRTLELLYFSCFNFTANFNCFHFYTESENWSDFYCLPFKWWLTTFTLQLTGQIIQLTFHLPSLNIFLPWKIIVRHQTPTNSMEWRNGVYGKDIFYRKGQVGTVVKWSVWLCV